MVFNMQIVMKNVDVNSLCICEDIKAMLTIFFVEEGKGISIQDET